MRSTAASLVLLSVVLCLSGCPENPPAPVDASVGTDAPSTVDAPTARVDAPTPPDDAPTGPPIFRNPMPGASDTTIAIGALAALGSGGSFSCSECHGLTRARLRQWETLSDTALSACLTDLTVASQASAMSMITCLRGGSATGAFHPTHAGVFATAGRLPWFRYLFQTAYGADWRTEYDAFVAAAAMPPDPRVPFNQAQFDVVAEWFIRGLPELETLVTDPTATDCEPSITPAVAAYMGRVATANWRLQNRTAGTLMYGCAGATNELECLAGEPLASGMAYGTGWDGSPDDGGAHNRVLFDTSYHSSYWTRSSADGRFVGHGGGAGGASIIDLVTDRVISVSASYDPGFFPDNSGFMILGGGGICEQDVLTTGAPTMIDFSEPGCTSSAMVGLYQHLGASLAGGDYFAVHGQYVSDSGGHGFTGSDPAAGFSASTVTHITRLVNSGSGFVGTETVDFPTPAEGDAVISPTNGLLLTRLAGAGGQLGYVLHRIDESATGPWSITAPEIARYCVTGGKPGFSYDERWIVYHHYFSNSEADAIELGFTGASDPGFASYRSMGAANVYLLDLLTGATVRITNMAPGQYALFPHFRADGWIYYIVRSPSDSGEIIVASDAALLLE